MIPIRRFCFIAIACAVAYVLLHVLRGLGVEAEARGLWAGATGYIAADLVMRTASTGRRKKRA